MTGAAVDVRVDLAALPAAPAAAGLVAEVGEPSPSPTQGPAGGFEAWEVSPGLLGFVPVFLIALACVGLFLSLTRQMRRVTVRQAQRDADDAAAARTAQDGEPGAAGPEDGTPPGPR